MEITSYLYISVISKWNKIIWKLFKANSLLISFKLRTLARNTIFVPGLLPTTLPTSLGRTWRHYHGDKKIPSIRSETKRSETNTPRWVNTSFCPVIFLKLKKTRAFLVKTRATKEVNILVLSLSEKQSKFENNAFLLYWLRFKSGLIITWWQDEKKICSLNFNKEHNVLLWTFYSELNLTIMSLTAPTVSYT